ncbi:amino acid ABC transporter permease [Actinacidiphila yeochonensis]|uniref:amino acid ABC transporter permease n=1 Tax=Actinacidiphila yeochonensis TaxID=89050 RepID=UPI000B143B19|nr:amino acid ABC transporter permease [Actinacidiphila yeochonensis]
MSLLDKGRSGPTDEAGDAAPTAPAGRGRAAALLERLGGADEGLFDQPGPRGRRRIAVASAVSLLALAALVWLVLHQFAAHGQLHAAQWRIFGQWPVLHYLLTALWATVRATLVSGAIALPLGALLALGRLARTPLLRWPATVYVEALRAVPLLLLIYAFLFGLPEAGVRVPLFWQLVWPVALTNAAVFAEIFRAGVRALPRGQTEAAHALGLSHWTTMRLVVLPQAIRQTAPALVSQVVRLLKDSSLGYVVSFLELLNAAKVLGEFDHTIVQAYLVVALIYVVVNNALAAVAGQMERRLGGAPAAPKGDGGLAV